MNLRGCVILLVLFATLGGCAIHSGCSGYAYTMDYADHAAANEQVFEQHGAKVFVSSEHLDLLKGLTLDFQKQGLNESFKFLNPNVKGQCGCGESFTV